MIKRKKKNYLRLIYFTILIISVLYLLFSNKGVIKYLKLKHEISNIDKQILNSQNEINKLKAEIDSLKHSDVKLEKLAREKYNMKKKNEESFKIEKK